MAFCRPLRRPRVFAAQEDVGDIGLDRVGAQDRALDELVRVAFQSRRSLIVPGSISSALTHEVLRVPARPAPSARSSTSRRSGSPRRRGRAGWPSSPPPGPPAASSSSALRSALVAAGLLVLRRPAAPVGRMSSVSGVSHGICLQPVSVIGISWDWISVQLDGIQ